MRARLDYGVLFCSASLCRIASRRDPLDTYAFYTHQHRTISCHVRVFSSRRVFTCCTSTTTTTAGRKSPPTRQPFCRASFPRHLLAVLDVTQRIRHRRSRRELRRTPHSSHLSNPARYVRPIAHARATVTVLFAGYFSKLKQYSFSSCLYLQPLSPDNADRGLTPVYFRIIPRGQASSLLSEVSSLDLLSIYNVNKLPSDLFAEIATWFTDS